MKKWLNRIRLAWRVLRGQSVIDLGKHFHDPVGGSLTITTGKLPEGVKLSGTRITQRR